MGASPWLSAVATGGLLQKATATVATCILCYSGWLIQQNLTGSVSVYCMRKCCKQDALAAGCDAWLPGSALCTAAQ
jgi:hypothetical protein